MKTEKDVLEAKIDFLVELLDERQLEEYMNFCEQL